MNDDDPLGLGAKTPAASNDPLPGLAALLRGRRAASRLSRRVLAQRTGLSESTLKNLEAGRHHPSQHTLTLLLQVPELRLCPADLFPSAATVPGAPGLPPKTVLNTLLAPGFDPLALVFELQRTLQGSGGTIDPSFLYLDAKSAFDWFHLAQQGPDAAFRELRDLGDLVRALRAELRAADAVDVLGLGCGDGAKEVLLVQHLLTEPAAFVRPLRLFLLDLSQPLLAHAFQQAVVTLPSEVLVFGLQGNFYHLPRYDAVLQRSGPAPHRRLLCFFGGTLGTLGNEVLFLRSHLVTLVPGDLLLLQVSCCFAPREDADAVRRLDPHLAGLPPDPRTLEWQWLTGPIERFARSVGAPLPALEVESCFDTAICPVPGSYAIEKAVLVKDRDPPRRFVVTHSKRYEPSALVATLRDLGWTELALWGQEIGGPLLGLFRWR